MIRYRAPDLLTSTELAAALGYAGRSGVWLRVAAGDLRLAACRLPGPQRRCWSRARLEAAGYLTREAVSSPASSIPAPVQVVATWRAA